MYVFSDKNRVAGLEVTKQMEVNFQQPHKAGEKAIAS